MTRLCGVQGCGRPGTSLLPRGRRCPGHTPAQPATRYCAPGRCYCTPEAAIRQHQVDCAIAALRHVPAPPPMPVVRRTPACPHLVAA